MDRKPNNAPRLARQAARLTFAAFLTGSWGAAACSSPAHDVSGSTAQAISGGTVDVAHESVFLLVAHQEDRSSLCTATLLAPNLLLTARHCVSPGSGEDVLCGDAVLGEPYPASAFFTTNDPQPHDGSPVFTAAQVRVPMQGTDTCGYDIALIVLEQNVPSTVATPAIPRIDREVMPGELYTAVGYGVDETGHSPGSRMQRANLNIECQPGSCGSGVESTEFLGEDGICSGDSGGPALDAEGKVVGVVSRGGPDCGTPIYGTVTAWEDFIVDVAKQASDVGGYEAPFWVTTGKSDPPELPADEGAGGASSAPSEPHVPLAAEGAACTESASCQAGLVCYSASGAIDAARCVAPCTATTQCDHGQICQDLGGVSVCAAPSGSADDKGCAISSTGRGPVGYFAWVMLGLFAMLGRRRRAHRRTALALGGHDADRR